MVNTPTNISADIFESLFGSSEDTVAGTVERSKQLMYWRKCSGCQIHREELGWIIVGPAMGNLTSQEFYEFQRSKHAEPLEKYGKYVVGNSRANGKYNITEGARRFEPLIELGGFHEIPLSQMKAYNWHRIPAIVKNVPELSEVVEYPCKYGCADRIFTTQEQLISHISVMHKDVAQPEAIGREISKVLEVTQNSSGISPEAIAQIVVAVREALKASESK